MTFKGDHRAPPLPNSSMYPPDLGLSNPSNWSRQATQILYSKISTHISESVVYEPSPCNSLMFPTGSSEVNDTTREPDLESTGLQYMKDRIARESAKGAATRNQQALWDKILEMRILLQKSIGSSQRLPIVANLQNVKSSSQKLASLLRAVEKVCLAITHRDNSGQLENFRPPSSKRGLPELLVCILIIIAEFGKRFKAIPSGFLGMASAIYSCMSIGALVDCAFQIELKASRIADTLLNSAGAKLFYHGAASPSTVYYPAWTRVNLWQQQAWHCYRKRAKALNRAVMVSSRSELHIHSSFQGPVFGQMVQEIPVGRGFYAEEQSAGAEPKRLCSGVRHSISE